MQKNPLIRFLFIMAACMLIFSCKNEEKKAAEEASATVSKDPKVANLKLPEGFTADHLFGPSENGEGSWVSMTFDNKGRLWTNS